MTAVDDRNTLLILATRSAPLNATPPMQDMVRLQFVYDELGCILDVLRNADVPDEDDLNDEGEEADEVEVMG